MCVCLHIIAMKVTLKVKKTHHNMRSDRRAVNCSDLHWQMINEKWYRRFPDSETKSECQANKQKRQGKPPMTPRMHGEWTPQTNSTTGSLVWPEYLARSYWNIYNFVHLCPVLVGRKIEEVNGIFPLWFISMVNKDLDIKDVMA